MTAKQNVWLNEHVSVMPEQYHPRRPGRGLLWVLLGAIVVLTCVASVAMSGWDAAIHRADKQTTRAAALELAADEAVKLRQRLAALQKDLADIQDHERALQAQLDETKALLAKANDKIVAAEKRAAAADQAASDAERARAQLQAKLDATPLASTRLPERNMLPPRGSSISAATAQSEVAPELPRPGLPLAATPRDYLVAAQQAVLGGEEGRAQSALEHAETRLLNQASLARDLKHPSSHPGITEIEQALNQLGDGDRGGALQTLNVLLGRHDNNKGF